MIALSGTKTDEDMCDSGVPQQPPTTYTHKTMAFPSVITTSSHHAC